MELLAIIFIAFWILILFKLLSIGVYLLTIPIKIVFVILSLLLSVFIIIPLVVASGLFVILFAPVTALISLLPFILVIFGIVLLVKNS